MKNHSEIIDWLSNGVKQHISLVLTLLGNKVLRSRFRMRNDRGYITLGKVGQATLKQVD